MAGPRWWALAAACLAVAGCSSTPRAGSAASPSTAEPRTAPVTVARSTTGRRTGSTTSTARPPAATVPATAATGSAPRDARCRRRGELPDPRCTPGARNAAVTQATIGSTICVSGWTATVRPRSSVTNQIKTERMRAYGDTGPRSAYELDHLIPLELGGAPADPRNLWPEPYAGRDNATDKDDLENALKRRVCAGSVPLAVAQRAIATNWPTALAVAATSAPPATVPGSATVPRTTTTVPPATGAPAGATARCNDGTYSFSGDRRGTCSRHGGVARWLRDLPS